MHQTRQQIPVFKASNNNHTKTIRVSLRCMRWTCASNMEQCVQQTQVALTTMYANNIPPAHHLWCGQLKRTDPRARAGQRFLEFVAPKNNSRLTWQSCRTRCAALFLLRRFCLRTMDEWGFTAGVVHKYVWQKTTKGPSLHVPRMRHMSRIASASSKCKKRMLSSR